MSELQDRLAQLDIKIESKHMGLHDSGDWQYDEWSCMLSYNGKTLTTTYKTGLGHRVKATGVFKDGEVYGSKYWGTPNVRGVYAAAKAGYLVVKVEKGKIVGPSIADVLSCLSGDAQSGMETFFDYCDNFGENSDSRKTLEIYLQCQRTLIDLRRLLGYDLFEELRQLEH